MMKGGSEPFPQYSIFRLRSLILPSLLWVFVSCLLSVYCRLRTIGVP